MNIKKIYFLFLAASILGIWFLTKNWLPEGYIIAGHDSGLALNSKEFLLTRFFAWDPQGFGHDNSPHFGSLVLHSLDYLFSLLAGVSYSGNQVTAFFWISALFVSAFLFGYQIRDKLGRYFPFLFPAFVTFNFFIIQSLFILERAKYSIFIASLLMLLIVMKVKDEAIKPFWGAVITSLILFFFNSGSWLGLPLYGGIIVLVLSVLLFEFLWGIKERNFSRLKKVTLFFSFTALCFLILNSYSILPYFVTFLKQDFSSLVSGSVISQNKDWLISLSQASSFLNLFRLQGVPDWYSGPGNINPAHAFANFYLSNKYLVLASFAFPAISFSSFFLIKTKEQKKLISFFAIAALLSMFFMAGSHKPLGFIYEFLFDHLPGFAIFRTPYFKFGSTFFIGVSAMMAFTVSGVADRINSLMRDKKGYLGFFLSLIVISLWILYHGVIFYPEKIFSWQVGQTTRLKVPKYVYDFSKFLVKADLEDKRIVLTPPLNAQWKNDAYNWGYWSLSNLPSLLVNKDFLANDGSLTGEEEGWLATLYAAVKNGDENRVIELSSQMGVGYFLLRGDSLSDGSWSTGEDPSIYQTRLEQFNFLSKIGNWGEWILYKIEKEPASKIRASSGLVSLPQDASYLGKDLALTGDFVFNEILTPDKLDDFIQRKFEVYSCESCILGTKFIYRFPQVSIFPNSSLYFIKVLREEKALKEAKTEAELEDAYIGFSLRRGAEIIMMLILGRDEKAITDNLKVLNRYLDFLYQLLVKTSEPKTDYARARKMIDAMDPIESAFRSYTKSDDFSKKKADLREEMIGVLWNVYKIKRYYDPILSDAATQEKEKLYYVKFPDAGVYDFFVGKSNLPFDENGLPVAPSKIIYEGERASIISELEESGHWFNFKVEAKGKETGSLKLVFKNLPNLFGPKETTKEPFLYGDRGCLIGKMSSFKPRTSYVIKITAKKNNQKLRLYIKDNENSSDVSNGFLRGDVEEDVEPIISYKPFTYLYAAGGRALDPAIYLCTDTEEIPDISLISVSEISSPSLIMSAENPAAMINSPKISYERINPTKYLIKVENATAPYILVFNERFSQFWKVSLGGSEHFAVNGYANGWKISKLGSYDITLEYLNQKFFYIGAIISLASLLGVLSYFGYRITRWRRKT